ncbi:hypothetical protein Trco_000159 [Trichoderma cornu-damae]|uniref:Uncharacterized protein n=1 Tax=Trichoderma cornu-damae TaxID=654480 RepID=A0A9P8QRV3_9HYPO|nr:hypothetical protein Trco_000159 [Trichoderma cornu-damae]
MVGNGCYLNTTRYVVSTASNTDTTISTLSYTAGRGNALASSVQEHALVTPGTQTRLPGMLHGHESEYSKLEHR